MRTNRGKVGEIDLPVSEEWEESRTEAVIEGKEALYFIYHGAGGYDFLSFSLGKDED